MGVVRWDWGRRQGVINFGSGGPSCSPAPPLPSPVLFNLFEKVEGEQVGRIEGLNIVLKNIPSCGTTPKNSAGRRGGERRSIPYPTRPCPLPAHPSHGPEVCALDGSGGGGKAGGDITSLSPGWAIELGFKDRPKIFLVKKVNYRAVFSLEK